jgi:TRAP-type C4-dicarboxylate transport system substrate-binding protein
VVPSIKVQELVKNHTEIPGSPTFYTATFVLAMNKAKYDALPADLKQVIDANSGQVAASMAGQVWDEQAAVVSEMVKKRGNTIITLPEDEVVRWRQATDPVIQSWLTSMKEKNLDGAKLLDSARALLDKYEKTA